MIHRDVVVIAIKAEFQKRIREVIQGGSVPRSGKVYERAREVIQWSHVVAYCAEVSERWREVV